MKEEMMMMLIIFFTGILVFVMKVLWLKPKKIEEHFGKQGIKGPPYCFFIGNVKEIISLAMKASSQPIPMPFSHNILPRVLSFYHHWNQTYGPMFLVWFGRTARLTLADPDHIREVFCLKPEFYEKFEAHPLIKQLEGDGLLNLKGEKWAYHRKIITPTFYMNNIKLFVPVLTGSVVKMLDKWLTMSDFGKVEIEVSQWYQNLTEDTMTRTAFGNNHLDGKRIFQLQARQMILTSEAFKAIPIPGYKFLPTKRNLESWKLHKEINKSLIRVIEKRRTLGDMDMVNGPKDLLGLMVEASRKESSPVITAHDIAEECKSFFFAGEQTTANLLTWTTVLLAMHPEWQVIARDEVLNVFGSCDIPTKDCVSKLKMLNMILNESLRLYPPIVASLRRAKANVELGGYKIPRGTEFLIPVVAIHHDQSIWGTDANEFNPRRFSNGVARASKHSMAFFPFGLGVRRCIGQNLAILQAKLTIAMILQRFSFELSPKYQHAPTVLMMLHPQHGAPIIFKHLRTSPSTKENEGSFP
ncbi:putative cytochrome P450 [Helianthus annuus]|nr:putative cytochrome P450 [Helianthus annuus]KAJ0673608.1 putative cytochrome P450 [Helianthus annuus]KAJ0676966.1 putative cytochrome P450 [Helianthus annuus]KAJ0861246.1 putative cytochrome P450 [Helianthus annuus]KAJ0864946.1 putative cytochrome P450 [Helianthus annuus]